MMKFSHLADVHIGSWRDPKLNDISIRAFEKAMEMSVEEKVDFILIAGDLFNTSLPGIDKLKGTVDILKRVKAAGVPVYIIAGSHDYSPSGKTMLDVLEKAGMFINVCKGEVHDEKLRLKFTVDPKTGVKITGVVGKRGMLDRKYYEQLDCAPLEQEEGPKIFMFHTALTELKPKELEKMESSPISLLPRGFDYYAGGHVHIVRDVSLEGYDNVVYPGPIFPNSFSEIEKLGRGGFYIYENGRPQYKAVEIVKLHSIHIDCEGKNAEQIRQILADKISGRNFSETLVTIRLTGKMDGKPSSIPWKEMLFMVTEKNTYFVMKNTNKLQGDGYEEVKIKVTSTEELEMSLIDEHINQSTLGIGADKEKQLVVKMLNALNTEKHDGEKNEDFKQRVIDEMQALL